MQVGGDHYKKLKVQPWDAMEAWMTRDQFLGYLRGNVIKYVARDKNGLEDLEKAQHYLQVLMEKTKAATPPCPCPIPPPVGFKYGFQGQGLVPVEPPMQSVLGIPKIEDFVDISSASWKEIK